jgi:hypothetical protein
LGDLAHDTRAAIGLTAKTDRESRPFMAVLGSEQAVNLELTLAVGCRPPLPASWSGFPLTQDERRDKRLIKTKPHKGQEGIITWHQNSDVMKQTNRGFVLLWLRR